MSSPPASLPAVLVLARDLILASRISATARAANIPIILLREASKLAHASPCATGQQMLIVDLNQDGALDAAIAWRMHRASGASRGERMVVGFVAHTDAETIRRARDAGIDRVLPRSRFVEELESILAHAQLARLDDRPPDKS
jgi:hypothetical protein